MFVLVVLLVAFVVLSESATEKLVGPAAEFMTVVLAAVPGVDVVATRSVAILSVAVKVLTVLFAFSVVVAADLPAVVTVIVTDDCFLLAVAAGFFFLLVGHAFWLQQLGVEMLFRQYWKRIADTPSYCYLSQIFVAEPFRLLHYD